MSRSESTYDAIVVGSGAAGSWAVKELTEGGLQVVLLEAGRNLDIARDFPADARWAGWEWWAAPNRRFRASRFRRDARLLRDHQAVLRQRQEESLYDASRKTVPLVQGTATRRPTSHVVETCTPHVELRVQSRKHAWIRRRLAVLI